MSTLFDQISKKRKREEEKEVDVSKFVNKQRTLVFSSRGVTHRDRHLISDLRDLLPHAKKDVKLDTKEQLHFINEIADMKNCNNVTFFESRKKKDLYMWLTKAPEGPSIKFLVQNVHTLAEVKLTGNCLKGSRPLLVFDKCFDELPHWKLMKELFTQAWGSPKGHPKVKPFIDHVLSFYVLDNRVWFRNYQIAYEVENTKEPVLVEIGPRFVLNPVKILSGGFNGAVLWENPHYVSPNAIRQMMNRRKQSSYKAKLVAKEKRKQHLSENQPEEDELADVFE